MSVTAVPTMTVGGSIVAGALPAAVPLLAVDELSLPWGRAGVLETPTPATTRLTVIDRSPGAVLASRADLIGLPVVLGWRTSDGATGTNFRGEITDADVEPLRRPDRGWVVSIAASSVEVELANYRVPEGTVWPAETFAARTARIRALFPAGRFTGGVELPDRFDLGLAAGAVPGEELDGLTAAQADVGGRDALALLRELYASYSPLPMVYDPDADRLTFAPRRRFAYSPAGLTMSAMLAASPDHGGRYVGASLSGLHLDAQQLSRSRLSQRIDSRITRVEVGFLDSAASWAQRDTWGRTLDTDREPQIGRRTLSVGSIRSTVATANALADLYVDVVNREARIPRLGPVEYSTAREPLHDAAHARTLLAGAEVGGTLFLGRSWITRLARSPLVGILGGTITYRAGEWTVSFVPAPTIVDPEGRNYRPLTAAAVAAHRSITLADVDRSVTVGDLGYVDVGAGFDPLTALPYVGNPL